MESVLILMGFLFFTLSNSFLHFANRFYLMITFAGQLSFFNFNQLLCKSGERFRHQSDSGFVMLNIFHAYYAYGVQRHLQQYFSYIGRVGQFYWQNCTQYPEYNRPVVNQVSDLGTRVTLVLSCLTYFMHITLMVFNATCNNISVILDVSVSFIGRTVPSTLRIQPTCCKASTRQLGYRNKSACMLRQLGPQTTWTETSRPVC